jgi:hypothetical protein
MISKCCRSAALGFAAFVTIASALPEQSPWPWQITAARAQESVVVEGISIDTGFGTLRIPRLEAEGSSVSAAEITSLLSSAGAAGSADRIAAVSATRWTIPEVVFEMKLEKLTQVITYRNVVLEEIVSGRIARLSVDGADIDSTMPTGEKMTGRIGAMTATGLDLAASVRTMTMTSTDPNSPLVTLYESFTADGYEIDMGDLMRIKVGRMSGRDFKMRPLSMPLSELFRNLIVLTPKTPGQPPTPEEQAKVLEMMPALLEIYRAYAIGETELADMTMSGSSPQGPFAVKFGRIYMKDFANARIGEMTFGDIAIDGAGNRFALSSFTLKGFDFGQLLTDLKTMLDNMPATAIGADGALATPPAAPDFSMPHFDEISLAGLDMDLQVPDPADPSRMQNMKLSLEKSAFLVKSWAGNIPASISYALDHLVVVPDPNDAKFATVKAFGIDTIDLSARTDVTLDQEKGQLALDEVSFALAKFGRVSMKGVVDNITADVFGTDETARQLALMQALVRSLEIDVKDEGGLDLILQQQSAAMGAPVDQLREQNAAAVPVMLSQMVGATPEITALGNAVAEFLRKGGSLTIVARSLTGVGMLDMSDPSSILDKADVTATVGP